MGKRANPMAVKAALTYEIGEAATALGTSPATIRNWIKDGLLVMSSRKPYLILGAYIRDYIKAKSQAVKSPLAQDELYCFSCRGGRKPLGMVVESFPNTPKTTRFMGTCERCGANAARMISNSKALEFAQTFQIKAGGHSEA
jgi:hypothetical protein